MKKTSISPKVALLYFIWGVLIVCLCAPFIIGLILGVVYYDELSVGDDFEEKTAQECIAKKIEKGYPENFAKEYCRDISLGCLRGRVYEENCNPEVKCCFVTIEEDKKWNYLDYDEKGNKKQ